MVKIFFYNKNTPISTRKIWFDVPLKPISRARNTSEQPTDPIKAYNIDIQMHNIIFTEIHDKIYQKQ